MTIDVRITDLPAGVPASTDVVPFVALGTDVTKKATVAQLAAAAGAVTAVTGASPITSTGGLTPQIAINGAVANVSAGSLSGADKAKLDGIGAGATVTGVTGTAPIVSSGGAAPAISINAAVAGVSAGSLSGADKAKLDGLQKQGAAVAIAVLDIDWSLGGSFYKALGVGANALTFSNTIEGGWILVQLLTAGGGSTVTWPAGTKFPGGVPIVQSAGLDQYTVSKVNGFVCVASAGQAFA